MTTPAPEKINARDITVEVSADGTEWSEIGGFTSVKPNPSENEETADTTTFDSNGFYEQDIMQRGATMECEAKRLLDPDTGEADPGQAICDTAATKTGRASHIQVRFRHPSEQKWKVWDATVTKGEGGGETNEKSAWSVTFTRSGPSTEQAVQ